ncbi:MarR family transcriptional regulator [Altererythrobacter sp. CAU 1778]
MPQADFAYAPAPATAALTLAVSIFGNDPAVIGQWRDDVAAAGFAIRASGSVEDLLDGDVRALGEVILVECAEMSSAACAALARLDMRAARSGAQVVIATTPAALDEVFACLDQCNPQILVNPTRADRVIALGRVLASVPNMRLREMPEDDRLMLLRLTEQVGRIAERLERLGGNTAADEGGRGNVFRFESPGQDFAGEGPQGGDRLRSARVSSPDPRLVRSVIRQRQMRAEFFDAELFADPA